MTTNESLTITILHHGNRIKVLNMDERKFHKKFYLTKYRYDEIDKRYYDGYRVGKSIGWVMVNNFIMLYYKSKKSALEAVKLLNK